MFKVVYRFNFNSLCVEISSEIEENIFTSSKICEFRSIISNKITTAKLKSLNIEEPKGLTYDDLNVFFDLPEEVSDIDLYYDEDIIHT